MNDISPKERLRNVLHKKSTDRPPVICPGGMMNSATVDVMDRSGKQFPFVHSDSALMSALAEAVHENAGFENFGIPFCMTVEAEVLGSEINFGNRECEPKIQKEVFPSVSQVEYRDISSMIKRGRMETVAKAGEIISLRYPDVPVIGSLTGPISTAASIVDPMTFLKELRRDKENAHKCIDYVTDFLVAYAQMLAESGFPVITIADPTATGEILGPKMFGDYAVPYLNKLTDAIHETGTDVIIHICGKLDSVKKYLPELHSDAVSTDALVNLKALREEFPSLTVMGNMSTIALQFKDEAFVESKTEQLLSDKIDIIAPACGLGTLTPVSNIRTMTDMVKTWKN